MSQNSIILSILVFLGFTACSQTPIPQQTEFDKDQINEQIKRVRKHADSLEMLVEEYKNSGNSYGLIRSQDELGRLYRKKGLFQAAIDTHRNQANTALRIGDTTQVIRAMNNIGTNFRRMGVLDQAARHHIEALRLSEEFTEKETYQARKNRVISLNGLGNIYLTLDKRQAADSIFRLALKGEQSLGSDLGQAINYANIGALFDDDGQLDSARFYYERSLECNLRAKSDLGISLCHTYFGKLYEKQALWQEALHEYQLAYDAMTHKIDDWHWMESCISLGRLYIKTGKIHQARQMIDKTLRTATRLNSWEHLSEAHNLLYSYHKSLNDHKKALDHYLLSQAFADSVSSKEQKARVQNLRFQYEQNQKEQKINLLEENYAREHQSKTRFQYTALAIVVLSLIALSWLYYMLRMRERKRRMLQSIEKMRRNFYTNITHEFRTPLTVILGYSRMIEQGRISQNDELHHVGQIISQQGENLLELINQILDISKIKSEIGDAPWFRGNVVPLMTMICESFEGLAQQKDIAFDYMIKGQEIEMDFAPDYMQKMLNNLLINALKYSVRGGSIRFEASVEDKQIVVVVADRGKGIPEQQLDHIFDLFYRCDTTEKAIGTGVGLALVKQIVDLWHGKIQVKSSVGEGSVFTIQLPLAQHHKNLQKLQDESIPTSSNNPLSTPSDPCEIQEHTAKDRPCVLIVEDNQAVAQYIISELKDRYSVQWAGDGGEGLKMALELIPDIMLCDVMMPQMDGYTLCEKVRSSELINHIPIVMITAKVSEQDRIKGIGRGADAYLNKPFNAEELHVQIASLLESRRLLREKFSLRSISQPAEYKVPNDDRNQQFLNRVISIVNNFMERTNLTNEEIASQMCISTRQLSRKIYAITGQTTQNFVMQIRLEQAKNLLDQQTDTSIGDIALRCGFNDSAYFSRVFKKTFQTTPSAYRKREK